VLSEKGGALKEFLKPIKFGLATVLGSGKQIVSWIHIDDLVGLYITAINNDAIQGVYNAVAPQTITNRELILQIAKARGKFYVAASVPEFALKLALGEMSIEILKSATVSAAKLLETGFRFQFPESKAAIGDLVK
jgi:uncharacterized protein (TIGR01777 family)